MECGSIKLLCWPFTPCLPPLVVLDREGLLRSGSPIPNLALVVAMFFSWVNQIEGVEEVDEKDYCGMIVALMERRGLIIGGLHKMEFLEDFEAAPTKLAKFDKIPAKGQVEKDLSKYTLAVSFS